METSIKPYISKLVSGENLSREEARAAMLEIMGGKATPAQIAGFIVAMRMKGETVDEITGCAEAMRKKAAAIKLKRPRKGGTDEFGMNIVPGVIADTCGTGGDGTHSFNISTAASFIVAGAGVTVAKHGNRSVSSNCGSADVMRALGVNVECTPDRVREIIDRIGIGFLFAPLFHSAMKHAIGPRTEIGVRTIFNVLGPLTNPAGANAQLIGTYAPELTAPLANVLKNLGCRGALVVHGYGGYDEISITGPTRVSRLAGGKVRSMTIKPEDFGFKCAKPEAVKGLDAAHNAEMVKSILNGKKGVPRDIVLLNAAATFLAAGVARNMAAGLTLAAESIASGAAARKLDLLVQESNK